MVQLAKQQLTDIPSAEVEKVVAQFKAEGATVEKIRQPDGTWTVTADFPDKS